MNPQAKGRREVAALFLRPRSARFFHPLCKNSDATTGRAIYTGWNAAHASKVREAADGVMQERDGRAVGET